MGLYCTFDKESPELPRDVFFGEGFVGICEDLLGFGVFDKVAEEKESGIVADPGCLLHIVRDDDDGVGVFEIVYELFNF